MKIFVVDDDKDHEYTYRYSIEEIFNNVDFIFCSKPEELERFKDYVFDIALFDWNLGIHDGKVYTAPMVFDDIKANKKAIVTGYSDLLDVDKFCISKNIPKIKKPFRGVDLKIRFPDLAYQSYLRLKNL